MSTKTGETIMSGVFGGGGGSAPPPPPPKPKAPPPTPEIESASGESESARRRRSRIGSKSGIQSSLLANTSVQGKKKTLLGE